MKRKGESSSLYSLVPDVEEEWLIDIAVQALWRSNVTEATASLLMSPDAYISKNGIIFEMRNVEWF